MKGPDLVPARSSRMASVMGTPTFKNVESWREKSTRSVVLTPKNVGICR